MPVAEKGTHPRMVWEGPGLISGFLPKQEEMSKAEQQCALTHTESFNKEQKTCLVELTTKVVPKTMVTTHHRKYKLEN